jgi:ABC-2 type transport system permease protein
LSDQWRELAALLAFVCVVTALAMIRYRRTLD